jgi:hypothetical protein
MGSNNFFNRLASRPIDWFQHEIKGAPIHAGPGTPGPYAGQTPTLADSLAGYTSQPKTQAPGTMPAAGAVPVGMNQPPTAQVGFAQTPKAQIPQPQQQWGF